MFIILEVEEAEEALEMALEEMEEEVLLLLQVSQAWRELQTLEEEEEQLETLMVEQEEAEWLLFAININKRVNV